MCELNYKRSNGMISGMLQHDRAPYTEAIMIENWHNHPLLNHRHSFRMPGYDYSLAGAYFVTIGAYHKICLFGDVVNGEVILNTYGNIATEQWLWLEKRFALFGLSTFVVMPNHVHGIIYICRGAGEGFEHLSSGNPPLRPYCKANPKSSSLGVIIRSYKVSVTYRINTIRGFIHPSIWQRNYYNYIIGNDTEYQNIWNYIETNPDHWRSDQFDPYPDFTRLKLTPA